MRMTMKEYDEFLARQALKRARKSPPAELPPPPAVDLSFRKSTDEERLNKTERAYLFYLRMLKIDPIGIQNITLKIADDCRYTCDFNYLDANGKLTFDEVKGFFRDDAKVKIKVAARLFPWIKFRVVKKSKNGWEFTEINP